MKKQLRKIALAVIFSMTAAMLAPAEQVAQAAPTQFTYAEQESGDKVTTLYMDRGEKIDLKYLGVKNHTSYKKKWASSDEKVAVVDNMGMITACGNGTATVKLLVGDGKDYSSTGVMIHVGKKPQISIGTATKDEIKSCTVELGKSILLKANGLLDNVGGRYKVSWSSTDTSVAKVSNNGAITTVAPGLTVIQLKVTKVSSGAVMEATPIALLVTSGGTGLPVVSPTPTVTVAPNATVTPTPTPILTNGAYGVTVSSDKSITLNFKNKVSYTLSDVELSRVMEAGTEDILIKQDVESVKLDSTGKIMTINATNTFNDDRYNIKVGSGDSGTTFSVKIGEPNRIEVVYSCLGQEGVAYAYSDSVGIDVPVNLSYKLYYDNIEITESYENSGYVFFEMINPISSEYIMLTGEQMYFYKAKQAATVQGTYTYYTSSGVEKTLKDTATIQVKEFGDYSVTGVVNWTIVSNSATEIDWNNPVKSVVANQDGYKIAALLSDSYGNYYSTDPRGVDKDKNIYSITDENTLFALKGYSCTFNPSNDSYFYIDGYGNLYTYAAEAKAGVYITLYNTSDYNFRERTIGAWQFTIKEEGKLNTVLIEQPNITLLTNALNNTERFCEADVVIKLQDQYGNPWDGIPDFTVTASVSSLNNVISYITQIREGAAKGEWILHIDGKEIRQYSETVNSVSFTVMDEETKKKDNILVYLKNPASNSSQGIVVGGWNVGMKDNVISYGDGKSTDTAAQAKIELYQVSRNGGYNVGLLNNSTTDENGESTTIKIQQDIKPTFTEDTCDEGDIFVLVQGPDKKVLDEVYSPDELGVYQAADGSVSVIVTPQSSTRLTGLKEGTYSVTVTKINSINSNGYVSKTTKYTSFNVVDNTKDVTISGYNNNRRTKTEVTSAYSSVWAEIVLELFDFNLGGVRWTDVTSKMVTNVDCVRQGSDGAYKIISIDFEVPTEGNSEITYKKTVEVNQTVYTGVN